MREIELLAPAKNFETGKEAINCGADAVYIGGSKFGARALAGNSLNDIIALIKYAHLFRSKVYVTLNTILFDNEIDAALQFINQLHENGIDAIIIQDLGLLELNLPPVPLFASTQMDNRNPEKVIFLEKVGFQRVILARELNLDEIKEIRNQTTIELEFFIHGALCVSYSGQCYISQAITKRSANRGECAQLCRLEYSLQDKNGQKIIKDKHLLSLKDLNLSDHIKDLIYAGISSFKIEGRLKESAYVKNVTTFYRKIIDNILEKDSSFKKASSGRLYIDFQPDPYKTFNRDFSNYFIENRKPGITSFDTPKSKGKYLGKVLSVRKTNFLMYTKEKVNNGDGLCFFDKKEILSGLYVNKVEGNEIFPNQLNGIYPGAEIYRNFDHKFESILKSCNTHRKIRVQFAFAEIDNGYQLMAIDEDNFEIITKIEAIKEDAKNIDIAIQNIRGQLQKSGNSIFEVDTVNVHPDFNKFIPTGIINELRRKTLIELEGVRLIKYLNKVFIIEPNSYPFPDKYIDYQGNISNTYAENFYLRHGAIVIEKAFETLKITKNKILMTTKLCLKYEIDLCPEYQDIQNKKTYQEPFYLVNHGRKFKLSFDCKKCLMKIMDETNLK